MKNSGIRMQIAEELKEKRKKEREKKKRKEEMEPRASKQVLWKQTAHNAPEREANNTSTIPHGSTFAHI